MTLLDSLLGNFGATITLTLETQTTENIMSEARNDNERLTTLVVAASTILDQIDIPTPMLRINDTLSYVESLSDEELARADQLLANIEFKEELELPLEQPKVYVKSNEPKRMYIKTYKKKMRSFSAYE